MSRFQEMATSYGTQFVYEEVIGIQLKEENCFAVKTTSSSFFCCVVILAFGKTPRDLGVLGEQEFKGKGVSYCAVCDGPSFKWKNVFVIGAGDPALDAPNYLAGVAGNVYIIQRTEHPVGDEELVSNLRPRCNVEFLNDKVVSEIKGTNRLESILIQETTSKSDQSKTRELKLDGIFV